MQNARYYSAFARLMGTAALVGTATFSQAEININGFATVGGGWYDGDSSFEGFDDDFSADPISKLGLQFTSQVNDQVSVTAQLLAKGSDNYEIDATWVYLAYAVSDDWDVRAGRLRTPFFAYSDFWDVSYAYPWIAPPSLVYRFGTDTVSGVDTLYRTSHGSWDATYQAYYGRLQDDTEIQGEETEVDLTNFAGLNVSLSKGWLTLRASFNRAGFSYSSPASLQRLLGDANSPGTLRGSGFDQAANAIEIDEEEGVFWGVGALINHEEWLFNAEYTAIEVEDQSVLSDDVAWYIMGGKRFGEFTVHLTYADREDDPDYSVLDSITNPALQSASRTALASRDNTSITVGMRYDFAESTSFKVELTQVEREANTFNGRASEDGTLFSFAIDTVF